MIPGFRYDIQGLRAIAVGMVVAYHLWPNRLTGGYVGVDVFFVISGYLITSHLLKSPPRDLRGLARFWERRIRRLLPASLLVLAATAVAARLVAPPTQWGSIANGVISSALYVQNWALARSSVDYLAATDVPIPTQHFWSLSLEEQFYLVWPLLVLAAFWFASRYKRGALGAVRTMILVVIALSLLTSIIVTASEPNMAYFVTPTRIWELAVGGLVATMPPLTALGLHRAVPGLMAWVGLGGVVAAGLAFTEATPFPGYAAILPVAGTALVILAGSQHRLSPSAVLSFRPIQWLGNASYSVYLWHWPLIALLPYVSGGALGRLDKVIILVITLVLAAATKTYVEDRYRTARNDRARVPVYRVAAAGMAVVTLIGFAQLAEVSVRASVAAERLLAIQDELGPCLGAGAIAKGPEECPENAGSAGDADPLLAMDDKSDAYSDDCWALMPFTDRKVCTYGQGETHMALVGNSHADQWLPALQALARHRNWTITTFLIEQCNPTDAALGFNTVEKTDNCLAWGKWVMDETKGDTYDLVITSERQSVPVKGETLATTRDSAVQGYKSYLTTWNEADTNVLVITDSPYPWQARVSIPSCLSRNPGRADLCSGTMETWHKIDALRFAAEELALPRITTLNMDEYYCPDDVCPAIIGSVIAYSDGSHFSATFAETMAPYMDAPITAALER
ncbi:Peptidoglycan/LPS O-acetylase OafA/YrhL, contains acyltransferase and SGNH-hydrolase domains [Cryobacterium psychrotolerans]|uniref:Peptidoglycan/LPS O-acetylase OafA/YrhL, contains acyltransferase and SGNH-hydrolase domains n=1 Tax=Cryobacterium psychrotolerans TaxID=386301 RepID=A0A1G9CL08_9MICO|nr:acyltransferase family protein [Cryobacterium psychrotolerans]TFD84250.1 acyltransferase [Cryobacterium psychrotolerans]SDK52381.1 Peptidoglycan/LPS O-acetylase OafA/YrhL, contains acyltransferase and SGNH-hydrolase domains [Cryobacterium psychrotolerans]